MLILPTTDTLRKRMSELKLLRLKDDLSSNSFNGVHEKKELESYGWALYVITSIMLSAKKNFK